MADPLQLGFTDYEQIYAKKRTRRQRFLEEMEITVPWEVFLALIKPVYHKPSSKGGRPPIRNHSGVGTPRRANARLSAHR